MGSPLMSVHHHSIYRYRPWCMYSGPQAAVAL